MITWPGDDPALRDILTPDLDQATAVIDPMCEDDLTLVVITDL